MTTPNLQWQISFANHSHNGKQDYNDQVLQLISRGETPSTAVTLLCCLLHTSQRLGMALQPQRKQSLQL